MANFKHYYIPQTLSSALEVLQNAPGKSRLIAGGSDLLLELQQGHHPPVDNLVDINGIPELQRLEIVDDCLIVGAAVPLKRIATAEMVNQHASALQDACALVGGPQVRNTATLGGNVSHALPAADGMIALMALQPVVRIFSPEGVRDARLHTLFQGPGKSTLTSFEIVTDFRLPLKLEGQASAFARIMRPQGVALPILNLAMWLERDGDVIRNCRIAVGPAGPVPILCTGAAEVFAGAVPNSEKIGVAAEALLEQVRYRSSPRRASAEYRKHITADLLREVVQKAWNRSF